MVNVQNNFTNCQETGKKCNSKVMKRHCVSNCFSVNWRL